MKASVTKGLGQGFVIEDVDLAAPIGHEVRVEVKASGLCHSDLSVATFLGQDFPIVLGHEVAGVVAEVGPEVTQVKVGDHVVGSLIQYCGSCVACLSGRTWICRRPERTVRGADEAPRLSWRGRPVAQGMGLGGFAQQALIHENQLAIVPDAMPWAPAALLGCGVLTGAGAVLNSAEVRHGDSVVIIGAGGVGMNAVSGARIAGAETIIVVDLEDAKLERAKTFGATHLVNSRTTDPVAEVRRITGRGADHVFDFVGIRAVTAQAMEMLAFGGGLYLIGVGSADAGIEVNSVAALTASQKVQGVYMGSSNLKRDIPLYASLYLQGRFHLDELVSREIALADIDEGYESLKDGKTARVVITDLA
ncbi:S-(hydroxymethyl)glutathione dehydrogenase/alcohol dehydrogenase [Actinocorallia herbida]|uniref:S-(Hydroxymethyl)glutathione dehydrogenase/alcohol dehydrogenase n=1 Tax=Actinocorallia herbida TaxID=58109 RepID=A0A3N1CZY5_9ACTN|nr:Zn-dependent alcohol dehydrogenase [Actinocorallia herbida]ROO86348.1 S-(hydroxymethyl)glutathione dehydrogenase/alcohol dehydrogenase [Actinocorallia herbida]